MKTLFGNISSRFAKGTLRSDLITVLSLLKRARGEDDNDLSVTSISTQGNGMKLHQGKVRLVTGSSHRGGGHWNRLPREEVLAWLVEARQSSWKHLDSFCHTVYC